MTDTQGPIPADRMVKFGDAVRLFFKNYLVVEGRSSRGAYWYAALALILATIVASVVDLILFGDFTTALDGNGPINIILGLATLIPGIAVGVRRLHDTGRSGWWLLITLTVIGVVLLIWWYCQPGERKDNRFGPDREAGR